MDDWFNLAGSGFPNYDVSDLGVVRNNITGRLLRQSSNQSGVRKVGLINPSSGHQCTVSVASLVAYAFLPPPSNDRFNTPINVDGVRYNNTADNLMWRPRWFAVKYHQQFYNSKRGFDVPIVEVKTGEEFSTSWEAAIKYGLLDLEIAIATLNRTYVFPTGQIFRVIRE